MGVCRFESSAKRIGFKLHSLQATEALKLLADRRDAVNRDLIYIDVWENTYKKIKIAGLKGKVDCPCCGRGQLRICAGA